MILMKILKINFIYFLLFRVSEKVFINLIPDSSIKTTINGSNGTKLIKYKENSLINWIHYSKFYIVIRGKINYSEKKLIVIHIKITKINIFIQGDYKYIFNSFL